MQNETMSNAKLAASKMYPENDQYYLFQKQDCCGNRYTDSGLVDHYCYLQKNLLR